MHGVAIPFPRRSTLLIAPPEPPEMAMFPFASQATAAISPASGPLDIRPKMCTCVGTPLFRLLSGRIAPAAKFVTPVLAFVVFGLKLKDSRPDVDEDEVAEPTRVPLRNRDIVVPWAVNRNTSPTFMPTLAENRVLDVIKSLTETVPAPAWLF